jgi:hypothetical protein
MASGAATALAFPVSRSDVPENLTRSGRKVKVKKHFDENGARTLDILIEHSRLAVMCFEPGPVNSWWDSEANTTHAYGSVNEL